MMKKSLQLFLLVLSSCFIISSCEKPINHPKVSESTMSGKIDGVLLECTFASAQLIDVGSKTNLQIIGHKGNDGFSLMIDDFKGVGTYNLASNNIAIYLLGISGLQDSYMSTTGNIIVTNYSADKIIEGTFQFKGQNIVTGTDKNITEGKFSISLVPVKIPETNSGTNNLNAKVDGVTTGFTGSAVSTNSQIGKLLSIISVNGDKRIAIAIIGYNGVGTYDIAQDGNAVYMKDQTPNNSFYAESGKLIISSETSNKLKGTFFFKGPNQNGTLNTTVNVTDGTFDLPYTKQ